MLPYSNKKVFDSGSKFFMRFVMLTLYALLVMASTSSLVGVQDVHAQKVYSITLNPIADAYTCHGISYTDEENIYTNTGGRDKLEVYHLRIGNITSFGRRCSYIMFDLKGIPEGSIIKSAKLQLYAYNVSTLPAYGMGTHYTMMIGAHYCSNSDWNEFKVTWDNQPSFSISATAIVDVGEEGWYSWDVTGDAKMAFQTAGKKLTEVLFPEHTGEGSWGVSFYSREGHYPPKLTLNYTYSVEVSVSGIPPTLSTNVYLDGSKTETLSKGDSKTFEFEGGTSHTIEIDRYISGSAGVRYYCPSNSWTFSSAGSKEFSYTTQYYLTVKSEYGSPQGEGWCDAGSKATISVSSVIPTSDWLGALGARYIFDGWTGDLASPDASTSIVMDKPKTVTATWRADYTMPYAILGLAIVILIVGASLFILMRKGKLIGAGLNLI